MNFINEIKNYSEEVCLILTKTDKVSDDIISEVFENISVIINNSLGKEVPCIITSKYDDDFNIPTPQEVTISFVSNDGLYEIKRGYEKVSL